MRATSTGTARKEARLTAPQGSSRGYRKVGRAQIGALPTPRWLDRFRRLERRRGGEVALADEEDRHDHADEGDRRSGPERILEPVRQRYLHRCPGRHGVARRRRRDRREDRDADRTADLLRGVDQSRRET